MVGELLGSYRITSELSAGGMGTVFRARHELLGREAAVKLLRPELTSSDELVQRFFNEAKAATAIRHPGIVEVYDFGYSEDGQAYLVMEFLDGEPLGTRLKRAGRLAEDEVVEIARGIASALKAAHGKHIVHRDLKPDNVFLVPDPDGRSDRIKVLDFGIAKLTDQQPGGRRHTQTGALIGTPLYMAPEQARAAAEIDGRADLYSLGCLMYEMLAGAPPFVAEGLGEIIAMQMFTAPRPVREHVPAVSPALEALVMRLLAKEPDERYPTAAALHDALGEVRAAVPAAAAPVPAPARRTALPLPLIAGAITLVVGAIVIALVLHRGAPPPASTAAPLAPAVGERAAPAPAAPSTPPPPPVVPETVKDKTAATVEIPVPARTVKRAPRPGAKRPPAGSAASPNKGLQTDNGSPIEDTLGP